METDTLTADMEASRNALRNLLLTRDAGTAAADGFPRSHVMRLLLNPVYRRMIVAAAAGLMVLATRGRSRDAVRSRSADLAAWLAAAVSAMRSK